MSLIALLALTLAAECATTVRPSRDGRAGAYRWPLKPFNKPHPVRGNFGDPRTRFAEPRSDKALLGDGVFSFHQGVDINAPDGTPVYPVASGKVTRVLDERVTVACGNGRSFQYWHIEPAAARGTARRGRKDGPRPHSALARARPSDTPGEREGGEPARARPLDAVPGRDPAEGAQDRRQERRRTGRSCSAAVRDPRSSSSKSSIRRLCPCRAAGTEATR